MNDLTPPPAQSLHVAWRGVRPGDGIVLAVALLGGGLFVLLDLSWGRLLLSSAGVGLVVVLLLPYRGMRLGTLAWLRLSHGWDALLTRLFPARRRELAALLAHQVGSPQERLDGVAETPAVSSPAWHPAWAAAWERTAADPSGEGAVVSLDGFQQHAPAQALDSRSWWPGVQALKHARDEGPWWPGLGQEGAWPKGPQTLGELRAWSAGRSET